jgi:flagellin-like protein
MKGVSAVIAVILILMIVVALAALAYTWFTGIFSSLTETAGTSITDTTTSMGKQFALDAASCNGNSLQFTVRNTGTGSLDATQVVAYLDGSFVGTTGGTGIIPEGGVKTYTNTSSGCGSANTLRVTIENGVSNSIAI